MSELTVTTDASIPTDSSIVLTVYEDADGDGIAENSETVTIADGSNTYTVSGFNASSGNEVWVSADIDGPLTVSESINSIQVFADPLDPGEVIKARMTPVPKLSMDLRWESASDWDKEIASERIVHDNVGDRQSGEVRLGYPADMTGLTLYYSMDQESGDMIDQTGNGYDLQLKSGFTRGSTGLGDTTCIVGDGSSGAYGAIRDLYYTSSNAIPEMTAAAWLYPHNLSSNNSVIINFDRSEYFRFAFDENSGDLYFSTQDGGGIHDFYSSGTLTENAWNHVAAVYTNDGYKRLYINGSLDNETAAHGGSALGSGTTRYGFVGDGSEAGSFDGSRNGFGYIDGRVDELLYFDNRALTSDEISALYDTYTSGGTYTSNKKRW